MFERRRQHRAACVDLTDRIGRDGGSVPDELSPEAAEWLLTRLEAWYDERGQDLDDAYNR